MSITLKVIQSLWLLLNLLAMFGFALPVHASGLSLHVLAYDGQTGPSIGYDERSPSVFDYDSASAPVANENKNRSAVTSGVFVKLAELLAAKGGNTPLWRAVTEAELKDLGANAGAFRNPFGIEVKYFSETAEGAASYARQTFQAGGNLYQGPYTIVRTDIPSGLITPIMRQGVDRGVPAVVVPTELLPRLTRARTLPATPLPRKP